MSYSNRVTGDSNTLNRSAIHPVQYVRALGPSGGGTIQPLTVIDASDNTEVKISVTPGTVNNIVPKIGSDPLTALPTMTVSGTQFILLEAHVNRNGTVSDVLVVSHTIIPADVAPADTDTSAYAGRGYLTLARVVESSGAVSIQLLNVGSKGYELASDDSHRFWRM